MQLAIAIATALTAVLSLHAASSQPRQKAPDQAAPEKKRLEAWVGTWDAEVSMMGETSQGTETCRLACGGHWLVTEHEGSFMGQPFQGKGFTGYDASNGAYTGAWIDSTGGPMSVYTDGKFSADGKTFTAHVEGLGHDGQPARFEYVSAFPDAKRRTFEIFQVAGGKRELVMQIRYAKRG